MSTSDNIVPNRTKRSSWYKSDATWTLGLSGTVTGTGVLFFPIRTGFGGLIPILLVLVLAYPITFYYHRALARLYLSGSSPSGNITEAMGEHFGKTGDMVIAFLYFFAVHPLLWIYGVTTTNTFMAFWENQFSFAPPDRSFIALFLLLPMAFIIWFGKDLMVRMMSYLVQLFIANLVLISPSPIPCWDSAVIDQVDLSSLPSTGHDGILITVRPGISIMVLSFSFSPIVSSFVVSKCEKHGKDFGRNSTERKYSQIVSHASMLMVAVVMFFVFNHLLTLSLANMVEAKAQNTPVFSYLANHSASMAGTKTTLAIILEYVIPIVTLMTIFKPFLGHYLGTLEGLNGLILKFGYRGNKTKISLGKLNTISVVLVMGSTQIVTCIDPNILDLIETMGTPIAASLLCLLPIYAIHRASLLAKYHSHLDDMFVIVIGLLTILSIVYRLFQSITQDGRRNG